MFATAKRRASAETDPEIKPYADKLVGKWEAAEPGHAQAIEKTKAAIEKCRAMK